MAGEDYQKRERVKMASWIKPAALRQQMINGLLQLEANIIFCFRAKEKTKPVKVGMQTKIVEQGWTAISGGNLLYEMTAGLLLLPKSGGVPTWQSDYDGERACMKLPKQFQGIFAKQQPLSEEIGAQLAEWARGGAAAPARFEGNTYENAAETKIDAEDDAPLHDSVPDLPIGGDEIAMLDDELADAAAGGTAKLREAWVKLSADQKAAMKGRLDIAHKPVAQKMDQAMGVEA